MPASSFSKIAIQLSRFANFQAAHQGANAFRGSAAGSASNGASSGAAASLSSAGAGPGSGAGGAKFSAGRGAYQSYTNTGGRAVVQAGSSSTNDGSNPLEDEDEHIAQARGLRLAPRRRHSSNLTARPLVNRDSFSNHALRFKSAFAANEQPQQASPAAITATTTAPPAELYQDLIDAKKRRDRVAVSTLVAAYRQLPASQQTTAGFNAALQAQEEVRQPGESLREMRETHQDMLEAGCLPNSSTSAVLVKALCARDQEKQADTQVPDVAAEEQASSEAWRVLTTSPSGLQDIAAYNALLARCAAKGDVERAQAVYAMVQAAGEKACPNAATYTAMIECYAAAADIDSTAAIASLKDILVAAIVSMRSPKWINANDEQVFSAYIRATIFLDAPEEAIALFERLVVNDNDLPSPSVSTTETLVTAFAQSGDIETASAWIEKLEAIEGLIALPDFSQLKATLRESTSPSAVEQPSPVLSSDDAASATMSTAPTSLGESGIELSLGSSDQVPSPVAQSAINLDLGERLKFLLRVKRGSQQQQPNIDAAYRLLRTELDCNGTYAPPDAIAQLLNLFGRAGKLQRVYELRDMAHAAIASASTLDAEWQRAAWIEVEDNVISALAHGGDVESAHNVRHALLSTGASPSANAYAALISSIRDSTDEALLAEQLWDESQRLGVQPNIYLVNTVISRLGRARRADRALQLYQRLPSLGLKPTSITYGASLNCAVRVGDIGTAEQIFEAMESDPAFVARPPGYNSMIQFFTYTRPDREKALYYWGKMQERGVKPSSHTYKLLLDVHGAIEPRDVAGMNAIFLRLLRDHTPGVSVSGPHWSALISCHSANLERCRDIFRSIPLKTGARPDAVAYEALLAVYAQHGRADLIDGLLGEMMRLGVDRTAYIANHAIEGYVSADVQGTGEGLVKARAIFLAMAQPPAGVASHGNHPLPRHQHQQHQQHPASRGAPLAQQSATMPIEQVLAATMGSSGSANSNSDLSNNGSASSDVPGPASLDDTLHLVSRAFAGVCPEPSTYERIIALEVAAGCMYNAEQVVARMEERAFPPALVLRARALLR